MSNYKSIWNRLEVAQFIAGTQMPRLLLIASILWISSCSIIKVSTEDEVKIYRKFGFINVISTPETGAYVDLDFVGIGFTDNDLIIGYKNSKKIVMPENSCTVFIDQKSYISNQTLSYLKDVNCTFIYLNGEINNE